MNRENQPLNNVQNQDENSNITSRKDKIIRRPRDKKKIIIFVPNYGLAIRSNGKKCPNVRCYHFANATKRRT